VRLFARALVCSRLCTTAALTRPDVVASARSGIESISAARPPFTTIETAAQARAFLEAHDAFLFDCDGVRWRGEDGLLPGTVETLALLERLGKKCVFVTNNAAKSRVEYAKRFARLGLGSVGVEQVVPSSFVAARWLASARPNVRHAFVIGADGLVDELEQAGVTALTARDFGFEGADPASNEAGASLAALAAAVEDGPDVGAVIVGHDTSFNFKALCLAVSTQHSNPGRLRTPRRRESPHHS
jgi:ribonucleotide monophosphatase NagD (HAD superfamily)